MSLPPERRTISNCLFHARPAARTSLNYRSRPGMSLKSEFDLHATIYFVRQLSAKTNTEAADQIGDVPGFSRTPRPLHYVDTASAVAAPATGDLLRCRVVRGRLARAREGLLELVAGNAFIARSGGPSLDRQEVVRRFPHLSGWCREAERLSTSDHLALIARFRGALHRRGL